jgi:small subunit ribosomal protein S3
LGQKVHPIGFRLGVHRSWDSRWFAGKDYRDFVLEDFKIRKFIKKKLFQAGVSSIEIERAANKLRIKIFTARPGLVIGKKGVEIENLKRELEKRINREILIDIQEVRKPEMDAQLVAENVALQLVRRVSFRRAMKKSVSSALRFGALGIKIACAGRLGGAEMARREWYRKGRVPLHTIRADIDYGFAEAFTTYGVIGVKVIIYKGEILPNKKD